MLQSFSKRLYVIFVSVLLSLWGLVSLTAAVQSATGPTVNLTRIDPQLPITIQAEFSEPVSNFTREDIVVENGAATKFADLGSSTIFTFEIAPTAELITISLPQGAAVGGSGPSQQSNIFTMVIERPTVELSIPDPFVDQSPITVSAKFSEVVTGFTLDDVIVQNGAATNMIPTAPSDIYTIEVELYSKDVVITIPEGAALGPSGPSKASNLLEITYFTGPLVSLSSLRNPNDPSEAQIIIEFDEAVVEFLVEDIEVENGSVLSVFPSNLATKRYTVEAKFDSTAPLIVTVPAGATIGAFSKKPNQIGQITINFIDTVFLPIVNTSCDFILHSGKIRLEQQGRTKGVTVFSKTGDLTLKFNELNFSKLPDTVSVSGESIQDLNVSFDTSKQSLSTSLSGQLDPGINPLTVTFYKCDTPLTVPFSIFYIPNGDFVESEGLEGWTISEGVSNIKDEPLTLKKNDAECGLAPIDTVSAALTLTLPQNEAFTLHATGTVFSQDQNPNNDGTYDAFEIKLDDQVVYRESNQQGPISCANPDHYFQKPINAAIPLANFSGTTNLSLENIMRYDNFFNTYSEITAVWIDY